MDSEENIPVGKNFFSHDGGVEWHEHYDFWIEPNHVGHNMIRATVSVPSGVPAIMVQSPNGGESWEQRNAYSIRWASTEGVGASVKLELYNDATLCYTVSDSTDNDGIYGWLVPGTLEPREDYWIKVTATSDPSVHDYSDGAFSITQSTFGGLMVLDGVDDYAQAADHPELDVGVQDGESLTVEAWVNYRAFRNGGIVVHPGSVSLAMWVDDLPTPWLYCFCFAVYTSGDSQRHSFCSCHSPAPARDEWHHIAAVVDGTLGQLTLYLDGEKSGQRTFPTIGLADSSEPLLVGANILATGEWTHFIGLLDEVRISDVARYSGDNPGLPQEPFTCDTNTRALWHFDEMDGATIFQDACGWTNNQLIGHNGAHTKGIAGVRTFLPLILR
jgi:hypothetical protein